MPRTISQPWYKRPPGSAYSVNNGPIGKQNAPQQKNRITTKYAATLWSQCQSCLIFLCKAAYRMPLRFVRCCIQWAIKSHFGSCADHACRTTILIGTADSMQLNLGVSVSKKHNDPYHLKGQLCQCLCESSVPHWYPITDSSRWRYGFHKALSLADKFWYCLNKLINPYDGDYDYHYIKLFRGRQYMGIYLRSGCWWIFSRRVPADEVLWFTLTNNTCKADHP